MESFGNFAGTIEQRQDRFRTEEKTTMRTLKLQVQMTVDGYIGGLNGEMDFMVWNWDDKLKHYINEITEPVDCIILGRKLAEGFISSIPQQLGKVWQFSKTLSANKT